MSDDLDELLRRAMKSLDDQVPSGYFEGLPHRTLLRLEGDMETSTSGEGPTSSTASGPIPKRDEDSGLHDIKNLASSQKMRTASRRSSQSSIIPDDDVLASSSGNWKAVALPEPAKMISLPELAELPAKQEQKKRDSKAKLRQSQPKMDPHDVATASTVAAPATAVTSLVPSADMPEMRPSSPAMQQSFPAVTSLAAAREKKSKRNVLLGAVGLGLAAAAGLTVFVATRNNGKSDSAASESVNSAPAAKADSDRAKEPSDDGVAQGRQWAGAGSSAAAAAPGSSAPPAVESATIAKDTKDSASAGGVGAGGPVSAVEPTPPPPVPTPQPPHANKITAPAPSKRPIGKADAPKGGDTKPDPKVNAKVNTKPDPAKPETGKGKKPEAGEPNLDDLLKDAGVKEKKDAAPKLEKKQLSAGDFKTGMAAVAGRAQACYNGTQGTATVRLTVAPSGKVSKATVSGSFAGTPVAACVESAVRAATFPPWDGGPQTFGYSYLLSE